MSILNTVLANLKVKHPAIQNYYSLGDGEVLVCISWGSKYDRCLCDVMMARLGYEKVQEVITERNGHSDHYSSEHTYKKQ